MSGKDQQHRPSNAAHGRNAAAGPSSFPSPQHRAGAVASGDGARSSPVAGTSSQVVSDLAAAIGPQTTDKSCRTCRVRKVKCDRKWPQCQRCRDRGDVCDFGSFVPIAAIPTGALQSVVNTVQSPSDTGSSSGSQVGVLRHRISQLEAEVARLRAREAEAQQSPATSTFATRAGDVRAMSVSPGLNQISPFDPPVVTSLTESISATFRLATGLEGPKADPQQRTTVETFLRGLAVQYPELYLPGSTSRAAFVGGGPYDVTESSTEWNLARGAMAKMLSIHLVQAFFSSCCAYLPIFLPWHERKQWILANIDNLDPPARVAAAVFCALGARASPHSAVLGVALPTPAPTDCFNEASAAGYRREQACRSLSTQALDLAYQLNIAHDIGKPNLDSLMVLAQMLIFDEIVPRKSRTTILTALGQYKELRAAGYIDPRHDTLEQINLPLLAADAVTAAYARKDPIIGAHEIQQYFPRSPLPDPSLHSLRADMHACLDEHVDSSGAATHVGIWRASLVLLAWVTAGQRAFAAASVTRPSGPPATLTQDIRALWALLDEAHEGVRSMQEMLIHLDRPPLGCAKDGCTDQHLRFVTRLDKDLLDLFFLTHSLVTENIGRDSLVAETAQAMYLESDNRIRKALKLTAFYAELYITSRDPHMTYHVFWQLEVFPNWTEVAVQQFGEPGGPADPALALSPTELDWLERGLVTASFYHPRAVPRLHELRQGRAMRTRPPSHVYAPPALAPPHLHQPSSTSMNDFLDPLAPRQGGSSLFGPSTPTGISPISLSQPSSLEGFAGSTPTAMMHLHAATTGGGGGGGGIRSGSEGVTHAPGPPSPSGAPSSLTGTKSTWNRHWGTGADVPRIARTG
ncbi:hypothetical protein JCM10908_006382 [Rhodotorula pacifica]|uniref:Zn(II)2Cys6 transcription factor domain-containing protein n=1 Tax=Rhodotorula pacifica TaxID=1495444 RepID=UPI00317482E1